MKRNRSVHSHDFREFVFLATGDHTDPKHLSAIDVFDNLAPELDRLYAVAELLSGYDDSTEPPIAGGLALVIKDSCRRMHVIIEAGLVGSRVGKARGSPRKSRGVVRQKR